MALTCLSSISHLTLLQKPVKLGRTTTANIVVIWARAGKDLQELVPICLGKRDMVFDCPNVPKDVKEKLLKEAEEKLKQKEHQQNKKRIFMSQQLAETPRMGIKVVKEVARGVAKVEPLTPRRAHQRPLLHLLQPQVTPRNAPRGITLPLRGITPRRGDWPGWPSLSWLQGWMSSSLMRSRGAAPKRRTWFSGSS